MAAVGIAVVTALTSLLVPTQLGARAQERVLIDEVIFFPQPDDVVQSVSRGSAHMHMLGLRDLSAKRAALADPNIRSIQTPRHVVDLYANPAPHGAGFGGFNPFQIQEVREALNWLIDRDFLIRTVYGGFAIPHISPWHPGMTEYASQAAFFQQLDRDYSFNPDRAKTAIFEALSKVPEMSFQQDGKWYYRGEPLAVRFVIRIEDERLAVGDYVSDQLESLGITVVRDYRPAAEAFSIVYFGVPDIGAWHLFTEGFTFSSQRVWEDEWLAAFYASNCDSWWIPCSAPDALVEIAHALLNHRYESVDQRKSLIRQGSELAMRYGLRIWILAETAVFLANKVVESYVWGTKAGPESFFSVRTARFAAPGGTLRIGQPVHWQSPWNPIRGFEAPYDAIEQHAFSDVGVTAHPHYGYPTPVRADYVITTAGPTDTIPINPDTVVWNTAASTFEPVPFGATAASKVTYHYTFGPWHDGTPMSMDDVWYVISSFYRRQAGSDKAINPYTGTAFPDGDLGLKDPRADSPAVNLWLSQFKGARQVDEDTIEIYGDDRRFDSGMLALALDVFPSVPWQVHESMAKTVLDNETRYDARSAPRDKVPLDLSKGASISLLDADLAALKAINAVPAGFAGHITPEEAAQRWAALESFRAARGHYYVSNGPFYIDTISEATGEVRLRRFSAYPVYGGCWLDIWCGRPGPPLPEISIGAIPEIWPGRSEAVVPVTAHVGYGPSDRVVLDYEVRHVATGNLVLLGEPMKTGAGAWEVRLDKNQTKWLSQGRNELVVIAVGAEGGGPVIAKKSFVIREDAFYFQLMLDEFRARLRGYMDGVTAFDKSVATVRAEIGALSAAAGVTVGLAILAIALAAVCVALLPPRPRHPPRSGTWRAAWRRYGSRK